VFMQLGAVSAEVHGVRDLVRQRAERLASFVGEEPAGEGIDVVVTVDVSSHDRQQFQSGLLVGWKTGASPGQVEVSNSDWDATLDFTTCEVRARLFGPWIGALESLLKTVTQVYALVSCKGLVLHASSVERRGKAFLFMGRSGTGKSTIALLTRSARLGTVLGEELTFVACGADVETPHVWTLPFGQKNLVRVTAHRSPLVGAYALHQSDRPRVVPFSRPRQIAEIARNTSIGIREPSLMSRALDAAEHLAARVAVSGLEFPRSAEIWATIDASVRVRGGGIEDRAF
jgi:hypothetical protein